MVIRESLPNNQHQQANSSAGADYDESSIHEFFRELFNNSRHPIRRAVAFEIRKYSLAENPLSILADVYMDLFRIMQHQKMMPTNLSAWVKVVARRKIIDIVRRQIRQKNRFVTADSQALEYVIAPPDELIEDQERQELLSEALAGVLEQLPPDERAIVELRFFQGMTWEQIQKALMEAGFQEISVPTLRKKSSRLLAKLRLMLWQAENLYQE